MQAAAPCRARKSSLKIGLVLRRSLGQAALTLQQPVLRVSHQCQLHILRRGGVCGASFDAHPAHFIALRLRLEGVPARCQEQAVSQHGEPAIRGEGREGDTTTDLANMNPRAEFLWVG